MESRNDRGRRGAALGAASLIITLFAAGCNTISDPSQQYAENARIEVTGTSPVPLLLISSTEWVQDVDDDTGDVVVELVSADTTELEVPFERTVALAPTYRIFFRVVNPDAAEAADIRMRVLLDDAVEYDQTATLQDAALEFSFFYR